MAFEIESDSLKSSVDSQYFREIVLRVTEDGNVVLVLRLTTAAVAFGYFMNET